MFAITKRATRETFTSLTAMAQSTEYHFDATGKADYADKMPVYITPENYRRKH